ncbi:MAG: metallophosphoesterase family protein [Xanthobacteraceae bacterium]
MFVLAHLSDPHLAPLPVPRWRELLGKRATGFVNWHRRRHLIHRPDVLMRIVADLKAHAPDHIAVTGDLVNIALAGEYSSAAAWLTSLGTPEDVTFVPGNHDAYVRAALGFPAQHWGDYMRADQGEDHGGEVSFPFLRRRGAIALIGLSSAVPSPPLMATGRLGSAQIAPLAAILARCRRESLFRVVLIHHPLTSDRSRRLKRLTDAAALRAVLAQEGAELVLHGHDHEHALVHVAGPHRPIPVVGVASASEAPRINHGGAGYNLYHIDPDTRRCQLLSRSLTRDGAAVIESRRLEL